MDPSSKKQINIKESCQGRVLGQSWHLEVLPPQARKALNFLSRQKWLNHSWYLAGGTALALQVGHRSSVDLDFFVFQKSFNNNLLLKHFSGNPAWRTTINEEGTVYGELYGAKVSFIIYPLFHPSQKQRQYGAIKVLHPIDIAVTKIITISQRGKKRDFFDLYWCAKNLEPLEKIIVRLKKQYPSVAHNYHHILKSLVYFKDAENDPDLRIHFKASWSEIKKFFKKEVPQITSEIIKLS